MLIAILFLIILCLMATFYHFRYERFDDDDLMGSYGDGFNDGYDDLFYWQEGGIDDQAFIEHMTTIYPFWNTQLGTTKNMSYDIRGDVPIPYTYTGPWNQSTLRPIQNKPLWMVS